MLRKLQHRTNETLDGTTLTDYPVPAFTCERNPHLGKLKCLIFISLISMPVNVFGSTNIHLHGSQFRKYIHAESLDLWMWARFPNVPETSSVFVHILDVAPYLRPKLCQGFTNRIGVFAVSVSHHKVYQVIIVIL